MIYQCCDDRRRDIVRAAERLSFNGIDYVNVVDGATIDVYFVNPLQANALGKANVVIEGGTFVRDIAATAVQIDERLCKIRLNKRGDKSRYTLRLNTNGSRLRLDPQLSAISFTFSLPYLDNQVQAGDFEIGSVTPEIDYLAKDYASFRQLMVDRLSTLLSQWSDPGADDAGIVLIELLAYVADHLSYQQDVIATEAYLGTARRRTSIRRHARMLDYVVSEGCNARTWVQVRVQGDEQVTLPARTQMLTAVNRGLILASQDAADIADSGEAEIFETLYEVALFQEHNQLFFYTWGARECSLPKGATSATLKGSLKHLKVGDVLIFQEQCDPRTGLEAEADPTRRHAVRLTYVDYNQSDPLGKLSLSSPSQDEQEDPPAAKGTRRRRAPEPDYALAVTEIQWHPDDALPFAFPISVLRDYTYGHQIIENVSIALGNIVLADNGRTVHEQRFATVLAGNNGVGTKRFLPYLKFKPLTYALPYNPEHASQQSVYDTTHSNRHNALPSITLTNNSDAQQTWYPRFDLLSSTPVDRHFVVESDDHGWSYLRFGDNQYGLSPAPGTTFDAFYRVGNGVSGNVGPATLTHIAIENSDIARYISCVTNPLPAIGGSDAQSIDDVRQKISRAFVAQERGVTPQDYCDIALRHPEVSAANAVMRWLGSWQTVFLTVERQAERPVDDDFIKRLLKYMQPFRMAGSELVIVRPVYVPLDIAIEVYVQYPYLFKSVRAALQKIYSNQQWPDGQRGLFYPDNFTLGQPVYLSPLYAAASAVAGVTAVCVTRFQRLGISGNSLQDGVLTLDWREIARLDNNPAHPGHGSLHIVLKEAQRAQ